MLIPLFIDNTHEAQTLQLFGYHFPISLIMLALLALPIFIVIYRIIQTKKTWELKPQRSYKQPKPNFCMRCFTSLFCCKNKRSK